MTRIEKLDRCMGTQDNHEKTQYVAEIRRYAELALGGKMTRMPSLD